MKNKTKKIVILILVLLTMTGCTKYVQDKDKKRVINEETGQSLTANILCLPESESLLEQYKTNEEYLSVKLESLPKCSKMKVYEKSSYNGLWVQIFVRPLAWVIIRLGKLVSNYGLSVMIVGLIIRLILMPLSAKTANQSEAMKKMQPEMERIEKKYANKTDQDSQMKKAQETMMLYQKYNINPISSCLVSFLQFPLFFAFLEAINRVPAIFENSLWKFQLGTTPLYGIRAGNYWYIILIVLIIGTTAYTFMNSMGSMSGQSEQQRQTKFMMMFMLVFISIASFQLPSAIALYWIVTQALSIVQQLFIKKRGDK